MKYEELRKQRLEANKERMEELNLSQLIQKLRDACPKSSPVGRPLYPFLIHITIFLTTLSSESRFVFFSSNLARGLFVDR